MAICLRSAVAMLVPDDNGKPVKDPKITSPSDWETAYIVAKDEKGNPSPFKLDYSKPIDKVPDPADSTKTVDGRQYFGDAKDVVSAARIQLHDHSSVHRDSDPRRFRIGHVDGRRGEGPQTAHPMGRAALADHSRRDLLLDRVLCRQLRLE